MALVTDDEHSWRAAADETRRFGSSSPHDRLAAVRIVDDELIDERRIAWKAIAEEMFADAQPDRDNGPHLRTEGRRFDPHVVGEQRRSAQREREAERHQSFHSC